MMATHELNCAVTRHLKNRSLSSRIRITEKLWHDFFSDPLQWRDHRTGKVNPRYPDFKHKRSCDGLWLSDSSKPFWVDLKLAAMAAGTVPLSTFSWNKGLEIYAKAKDYQKVIETFQEMQRQGVEPDQFTFIPVLSACSHLQALAQGRCIHKQIIQAGHEWDLYVGSSLVDMYVKCGSIGDAWRVFNELPKRNVVSWTTIILGYVKCEQGKKALELFRQMQENGVEPNSVTFMGMLNACASLVALEEGRCIHAQIIQRDYESNVVVSNCLIDMYAKCGSIGDAWAVFTTMPTRDVASWNTMIAGCVKCGQGQKALGLSRQMHEEGMEPDLVTLVAMLTACGSVVALEAGRLVHQQIVLRGFESNVVVGNCLVDMYAKCGSIEDAWKVFNKMPTRDVISWNAMIIGYVKCGQGQKALELSRQIDGERVGPNRGTFLGLLNACASLAALGEGRRIHAQIIRGGYESDLYLSNSLIDMYSKCGSIEDAWGIFKKMRVRDVVSWNVMLGGCARHGNAREVLAKFEQMCQAGVHMNGVTFISLLSACSHAGLVDEGQCYFESMRAVYSVLATVDHYTCMVDLLCRAGRLHEAENLIKTMKFSGPTAVLWTSLLGACRVHGNVALGGRVAGQGLNLESEKCC